MKSLSQVLVNFEARHYSDINVMLTILLVEDVEQTELEPEEIQQEIEEAKV